VRFIPLYIECTIRVKINFIPYPFDGLARSSVTVSTRLVSGTNGSGLFLFY